MSNTKPASPYSRYHPQSEACVQLHQRVMSRLPERKSSNRYDRETYETIAQNLVANAVYHYLLDPKGKVRIGRHTTYKRDRYLDPTEGTLRPFVLNQLHEAGVVKQRRGTMQKVQGELRGIQTTLRATPWLVDQIKDLDLTTRDFTLVHPELVLLRAREESEFAFRADVEVQKELLDYEDTPHTLLMRDTVRAINEWLDTLDIELVGKCRGVDVHWRKQRRFFTTLSLDDRKVDKGGRWFGGFWQAMSKAERFKHIRLDGEPIAELDFKTLYPNILRAFERLPVATQDVYSVPDVPRSHVKVLLNKYLFWQNPSAAIRWPKGWSVRGVSAFDLLHRLIDREPVLDKYFHTGIGYHLQFIESEIMAMLYQGMRFRGIPALGIHDAVLVPQSRTKAAREVMEMVYHNRLGQVPAITERTN